MTETPSDTNGDLTIVNREFAINWQNEAHQSLLHRTYRVRVTHCGESSRKYVSGTESCRERRALSLSLCPSLSFPPHVALCRHRSNSFWQALFFLVAFQIGIGWHSLPVKAETDLSKHSWISAFRQYSLLMTCWEACNSKHKLLEHSERYWEYNGTDNFSYESPW